MQGRFITGIAIITILSGCVSSDDVHRRKSSFTKENSNLKNRLIISSSGLIGCSPNDIAIREFYEFSVFHATWEAHCKGKLFFCSQSHTSLDCTPELITGKTQASKTDPSDVQKQVPPTPGPVRGESPASGSTSGNRPDSP